MSKQTRTQINIRLQKSELKQLKKAAKSEGYEKFTDWVKAALWDHAGIEEDPIDLRSKG